MEENPVRWHIIFSGRVQAVGFRFTAQILAQDLSLTGWVRNLYDGRVEMEVQGPVSRIRQLIIQLKSRPPIHIEDFHVNEIKPLENEKKFSVLSSF